MAEAMMLGGLRRCEVLGLAWTARIAVALAVAAAYQGVWATAFAVSFYNDFSVPGLHWVAALGPYNVHLARDAGALNLALLVLSVCALRRPTQESMVVTGGAWLIYSAISSCSTCCTCTSSPPPTRSA